MSNVDFELARRADELARKCFRLKVQADTVAMERDARIRAVNEEYDDALAEIQNAMKENARQFWQLFVPENLARLLVDGKRSFVTPSAIFQFRKVPGSLKVTDKKAALKIARKLRLLRQVAHREWVLDPKALVALLGRDPALRRRFEECIEDVHAQESLAISPNGYRVQEGNKRISPFPVKIENES